MKEKGKRSSIDRLGDFIISNLDGLDWLDSKQSKDKNFFEINYKLGKKAPKAKDFLKLARSAFFGRNGVSIDPFDGLTRSYIEIGAWLGSQQLAFCFMAISESLGLAEVTTPTLKKESNILKETIENIKKISDNSEVIENCTSAFYSGLDYKLIRSEIGSGNLYLIPNQQKIAELDDSPKTNVKFSAAPKESKRSHDFKVV